MVYGGGEGPDTTVAHWCGLQRGGAVSRVTFPTQTRGTRVEGWTLISSSWTTARGSLIAGDRVAFYRSLDELWAEADEGGDTHRTVTIPAS